MKLTISESVGESFPDGTPSSNRFDDVLVVQYLSNQAAVGLTIPLPLDGTLMGPGISEPIEMLVFGKI
jgi:hypothetical protein